MEGDDPLQQQQVEGIHALVQATGASSSPEGEHLAKLAALDDSTVVLWKIAHLLSMFLELDYRLPHVHQGCLQRFAAKLQQLFQWPP